MPPPDDQRFFFIHVMKTGGTSFVDLLRINFTAEQRYPDIAMSKESSLFDRMEAYTYVPGIVDTVNDHLGQLRMVRGHVPYAVRSLLDARFTAMTILRHPVERTLSYLKHCRKYHAEHSDMELEQIYEEPWYHATFIHNYQTKIFSMTAQESLAETRFGDMCPSLPPRSHFVENQPLPADAKTLLEKFPSRFSLEIFSPSTAVINVDKARLDVAKDNLAEVELVGVTEDYDKFLQRLGKRYNWDIREIPRRNVGELTPVSTDFRERIAKDNALDMDLYETALSLAK